MSKSPCYMSDPASVFCGASSINPIQHTPPGKHEEGKGKECTEERDKVKGKEEGMHKQGKEMAGEREGGSQMPRL